MACVGPAIRDLAPGLTQDAIKKGKSSPSNMKDVEEPQGSPGKDIEESAAVLPDDPESPKEPQQEESQPRKPWTKAAMPVFACGAGLFSDGYINNVS